MLMVSAFTGSSGGSFPVSDVGRVFLSAWRGYVEAYANVDPAASSSFGRHVAMVMNDEFGSDEAFRAVHVQPGKCFFVCWDERGRLSGHVAVAVVGEQCELSRMAVSEECQGRGVARLLHTAALSFAASRGCRLLWLTTGQMMRSANALYARLGYGLVSRTYMAQYNAMINRYEWPISRQNRVRFYDCEIAVHETADGWLEARHDRRIIGAVHGKRLWEERGSLDEQARIALRRFVGTRERGDKEKQLVVMGEKMTVPPKWKPHKAVVRRMRAEDELELRALFVQSWVSNEELWLSMDPPMAAMIHTYVRTALLSDLLSLSQSYERVFVASNCGVLLGMVALTAEGELKRLAVHPHARGLGVGRLLVSHLEDYARKRGTTESS